MIKITDKEGKTVFVVPDDGSQPIAIEDELDKEQEESKDKSESEEKK